jgi:hypothetical protein
MQYKVAWSGLADLKYYSLIAKFCLPSWRKLPGDRYVVHDSDAITIPEITTIDWKSAVNNDSRFLTTTRKKKTLNFWRKMQSQLWAINNIKDVDFVVLLDTDIEVLTFDDDLFELELTALLSSGNVWAAGKSQLGHLDAGFIIIRMQHPRMHELISRYEDIWESGDIYKLNKSYDGHAVQSLFSEFPAYRLLNKDHGNGLHIYPLGLVHWGSKQPKQLRSEWIGTGADLIENYLATLPVKIKKT